MNGYATTGALIFGALFAIGTLIYNMSQQNRQHTSHRNHDRNRNASRGDRDNSSTSSDRPPPYTEASQNLRSRTPPASPIDTTHACVYCDIPISGKSNLKKMACNHYAHSECFSCWDGKMRCGICLSNEISNEA